MLQILLNNIRVRISIPLFLLIFLSGMAFGQSVPQTAGKIRTPNGHEGIAARIKERGSVRIIVQVDSPFQPMVGSTSAESRQQMGRIASAQDALLSELTGFTPHKVHQYRHIPYIFMEVDEQTMNALLASPRVLALHEDIPYPPTLDLSVPRIGAPSVWAAGHDGTGVTVAVLDTGVDKTHTFLSKAVVSEACFSTNETNVQSMCPGGVSSSINADSAMPYAGSCPAGECDHGTHVSGILSGRQDVAGSPGPGVAPGAGIIAIQIFSRFNSEADCGDGKAPCALSYPSDMIRGLERVYDLSAIYNIASVNMSLGGGQYFSNCDVDEAPTKAIIDNLKAVGIATVISSGNNYYCGSMGAPGCISSAVSVGATTDADAVAGYSNSASFLSLLAPGSTINSSVPGGTYQSWNGTSMAAPHVAGAWALMKQALPGAGVDRILSAFTATGLAVTDSKCDSVTKKRINVSEALIFLLSREPSAQTDSATVIGTTEATLNGTVNAKDEDTTVTFEYGTTTSYGSTMAAVTGTVTGSTNAHVSVPITGLVTNTFYHFRVKAVNSEGTSYGSDMTFATSGPCGSLLDGSFELGTLISSPWSQTSTNYGTPLCDPACSQGVTWARTGNWWSWFGGFDSGIEAGSLTQTVNIPTGISPRLEFYLWNSAASGNGADFVKVLVDGAEIFSVLEGDPLFTGGYVLAGLDLSAYADGGSHSLRFDSTTTGTSASWSNFFLDDVSISCVSGSIPAVATGVASSVSSCGSTLNGTANAYGTNTTVIFDYGVTTDYGSTSAAVQSLIAGSGITDVSIPVSGLTADTTYHYRVRGQSASGIAYGRDGSFSTPPAIAEARIREKNFGSNIETAVSSAVAGDEIMTNTALFIGNPVFSGAETGTVTLSGGFDCEFISNPNFTPINGSITFGGSQTVIVEKISLQ
ncbi:MAG: S8 family serine peptidase [Thermodesulfovibrionales bacterium]